MIDNPKPFEIYRHFKGNLYQIIALAKDSEDGTRQVVYQALYGDFQIYVRPLSQFMSEVDSAKYPVAVQKYRFEKVSSTMEKKPKPAEVEEKPKLADMAGKSEATEEMADLDPMLLKFLDAENYEERLNILTALHHRLTDDMVNTMAIAVDVEVEEGPMEERYKALKTCLLTKYKFESSRMR